MVKRKATADNPLASLGVKGRGKATKRKASTKPSKAADTAGKTRLTVYLEPELHRRLRMYAAGEDRSYTDVVADLLARHLPKGG